MPFFLITFLISLFAIPLTWLTKNPIGITNIFQCIYQTAADRLVSQGLSIFAFAFFVYALLQSQTLQAFFASKRKWLEKRKYFAIGLITIIVALLSSNLSWFDEFVHFYPLVIPLMLALGFDIFSSILCLYGGSIAGLLGLMSSQRTGKWFGRTFGSAKDSFNYNGWAGIGFRLVSFALFVSIVILFNIWYCSRNKQSPLSKKKELIKEETPPPFNRTRKIILAVAGFFLLGSILAQVPWIAGKINESKLLEKISPKVSSEYEIEEEKEKHVEAGRIGKTEMFKAKESKEKYWGTFGEWGGMALDCWLIIGAIIICLLARQSIIGSLTTAVQNAIPLVLIYILSDVPAVIIAKSGISKSLAPKLLPKTISPFFKYKILFSIFGISLLANFFVASTGISAALVGALAPTLLAVSESTLVYASIFSWTATIFGMAFSPFNGILIASLEKGKTTYKQFIKKTWPLAVIMSLTLFGLLIFWTKFYIN